MLKWFKILLLTVCFAFSCQAFAAIESSSDKLLDSEKHGVVYDHQQKTTNGIKRIAELRSLMQLHVRTRTALFKLYADAPHFSANTLSIQYSEKFVYQLSRIRS